MTSSLFSAGGVLLAAVLGGFVGAWINNHYATRAARLARRQELYREVLFASQKITFFAGMVISMPGWRLWLPGSGVWRDYLLRLLSEAIEPGLRTMAELVLKDDPSYKHVMELLGQLTDIQQEVTSRILSWKRDPTMVDRMQVIIGQLRDVMREDLAKMERSRW